MTGMTAFKTITCNYRIATKANSQGAKGYLVGGWSDGAWERIRVLCRSRNGRWIEKWEHHRHLTDFRLTTIVPESAHHERIRAASIFGPDTRWTVLAEKSVRTAGLATSAIRAALAVACPGYHAHPRPIFSTLRRGVP